MATFFGQLFGFALIVFLVWKYVAPPVKRLMERQQDAVRTQLADSASATTRLADADSAHTKALEDAKAETVEVTEEARRDAERIGEQLRVQADAEVERIKVQGAQQVELLRQQLIRELRQNLGSESVHRAGELVRAHVAGPAAQSATVDRMLDELDAMAPSTAVIEYATVANFGAASRIALAAVVDRFNQVASSANDAELSSLAEDLAAIAKLLTVEVVLNKHLAEPVADPSPRERLIQNLLGGRVGARALDVVKTAVVQRWSAEPDLVDSIVYVARLALLARAERHGEVADVEDQLFRFGRILDAQPRLATLLGDYHKPAAGRLKLLDDVLEGSGGTGVNETAAELLSQTVELLRGQNAETAVEELAQLAVARRGEVVAYVTAAAELSGEQRTRLTELLSRIYGHPVSVQLHIEPSLLGGLSISVGEEVIDGSISAQLAAARMRLPD